MSHARNQIRDAAAATLSAYPVSASVETQRVWPIQSAQNPVVGVYTNDEVSQPDDSSFNALLRELALSVDCVVNEADGKAAADALDDLAVEVETALGAARRLIGVQDIQPTAATTELNTEGETVIGRLTLTFSVYYRTAIGAPETII